MQRNIISERVLGMPRSTPPTRTSPSTRSGTTPRPPGPTDRPPWAPSLVPPAPGRKIAGLPHSHTPAGADHKERIMRKSQSNRSGSDVAALILRLTIAR